MKKGCQTHVLKYLDLYFQTFSQKEEVQNVQKLWRGGVKGCTSLDYYDPFGAPWLGLTNKRNVETRGFDFSGTEAWLTLVGGETLDSDLGIFIPKKGLDIATTDEFAKTNKVKTIDENENQQ